MISSVSASKEGVTTRQYTNVIRGVVGGGVGIDVPRIVFVTEFVVFHTDASVRSKTTFVLCSNKEGGNKNLLGFSSCVSQAI